MGFRFIYDRIPSELYGLSILFVEDDPYSAPSGSGFSLEMNQVKTSPGFLYLGERQDQRMEFPVGIYCERPMDVLKQTRVKDWLFGGEGWKRLQKCAKHQNTYYYNCRLVSGDDVNFYGYVHGPEAPGWWFLYD